MDEELKAKAEVIRDLLAQGVEEVSIIGTDIKVVRKKASESHQQITGANKQNINVNVLAQASAQSTTTLVLRLNLSRLELKDNYKNDKRLFEIEKKLDMLEKEIAKASPNKNTLKKILQWALNFGWDVFLKIAPIVIDKVLSST